MVDKARLATRAAVRDCLADLPSNAVVLVACSGGADSLALAEAASWVAPRAGLRAGAVVIDHQLQPGSAEAARAAATACAGLGLAPVETRVITVVTTGGGPESDARQARYAAITEVAERLGAAVVLLGHNRDDQAQQVLMGLVRGSGTRSLAAIPPIRGRLRRPFLTISRAQTEAACAESGLTPWQDPHNEDARFLRVRARSAMVHLEGELGPGVVAALARTAAQARIDADYLDALGTHAYANLGPPPWPIDALVALPLAVRTRVWRAGLIAQGAPAGALAARHTDACERLITHWHGQGPVQVPGPLSVARRGGVIAIAPIAARADAAAPRGDAARPGAVQ